MSLYYTKNGKNGHASYGNGHNHNGHNHNGHGDMSLMHDELDVVQGDVDLTLKLQSPKFLEQFELDLPPVDLSAIETATHDILEAVGENPQREGLQRTPNRVARAYDELLSGYRVDPAKLINEAVFSVEYDDMVIVRDIEFYSMCEHHMLPFIGRAHVAYLSNGKVIGLSKIPRIVDMFARRLQVQERMTHQIAQFLNEVLEPRGVAVVLDGVHMCSMMRGVQKSQSSMTTSAMLGVFREDEKIRAEFLNQISRSGSSAIFGA